MTAKATASQQFGDWFRYHRVDQGYTQRAIATELGVGFPHISKIERGRETPSFRLIAEICELLDLDLEDMLEAAGRCRKCGNFPEPLKASYD